MAVVIVLEQFAHHNEVKHKGVAALVIVVEILVTIHVATPVDNSTMYRAHQEMDRQEHEQIPHICRDHEDVDNHVQGTPTNAAHKAIAHTLDDIPDRILAFETHLWVNPLVKDVVVDLFRTPHHRKDVASMVVRRVRIVFGIAVGMVHPVEDSIGPWAQIRRPLGHICEGVKETFPELAHGEHFMCRIAVQEKSLREQRQVPVCYKKHDDEFHLIGGGG